MQIWEQNMFLLLETKFSKQSKTFVFPLRNFKIPKSISRRQTVVILYKILKIVKKITKFAIKTLPFLINHIIPYNPCSLSCKRRNSYFSIFGIIWNLLASRVKISPFPENSTSTWTEPPIHILIQLLKIV